MAQNSPIEWTDATWNPVTGCSKVSIGCQNCYAEKLAKRLEAMGNPRYKNGFKVTVHEDLLDAPYKWKKPRMVFVNSMSDLFHEDIPTQFVGEIFKTMRNNPHHIFQVLTKRAGSIKQLPQENWTENIWMGVTVEAEDYIYRINELRATSARTRFLSLEPLLTRMPELDLSGIDWVIVGGESGSSARTMKEDWVLEIRDACLDQEVPFFFKQWGGVRKKARGRLLEGITWEQYPPNNRSLALC